MLLSARFLIDVASVNSFEPASAVEFNAGDAQNLYIQLIDASVDRPDQGYNPSGRRYMPPAGSTLMATFTNTDTGASTFLMDTMAPRINPGSPCNVIRAGTVPFPQDGSIWAIPILGTDKLNGTVNIKITLAEPGRTLSFYGPRFVLRMR